MEVATIEIFLPPVLSVDEERRWFGVLHSADEAGRIEARQKLARHNIRLVHRVVDQFNLPAGLDQDACSSGLRGLLEAIESFEPGRGFHFSTYAWWIIYNRIRRDIGNERKRQSREVSYESPSISDEDATLSETLGSLPQEFEQVLVSYNHARLRQALGALTDQQRQVVVLYYGQGVSSYKGAPMLGISTGRFCRILNAALKDIRRLL